MTESEIRNKFKECCSHIGSDSKVESVLKQACYGFAIDRSQIGKIRRGEGKLSSIAMATKLLEIHLENNSN